MTWRCLCPALCHLCLSSLSLKNHGFCKRSERRYEIRTQKSNYEKLVRENQEQQESSMVSIAVGTRSLLFFFCFLSCGVKRKSATRGGVWYEHTSNTLDSSSRPCLSAALGAEMTHLILTSVNRPRCTKVNHKSNQKSRNPSFISSKKITLIFTICVLNKFNKSTKKKEWINGGLEAAFLIITTHYPSSKTIECWRFLAGNRPKFSNPGNFVSSNGRCSIAMWGFLKCLYPTTMGFPTKNDHFGVFWGYHHLRKHPCEFTEISLFFLLVFEGKV